MAQPASAFDLIVEYLEAFKAANTMSEPPDLRYEQGWFTIKSPRSYPRKFRRHAVIGMIQRLRERAALPAGKR